MSKKFTQTDLANAIVSGWEDKWKDEILAVKELGEQIGYGNMMDIASSLWCIMLDDKYGHSTGAFEPVCIAPIDKKYAEELKISRKKRNEQIRKIINGLVPTGI